MTTGQDIHDRLMLATKNATDTLAALQAALDASYRYGFTLAEKAPAAFTFATGTFAYSLAAITALTPDLGAGQLWVNHVPTAQSALLLRAWRQEFDRSTGAWTVYVPSGIASGYNGKTVDVLYNYRHPAITSLSDTLYIPAEFARYYVQACYAEKYLSMATVDTRAVWAQNHRDWMQRAVAAILAHPRGLYETPHLIPDILG